MNGRFTILRVHIPDRSISPYQLLTVRGYFVNINRKIVGHSAGLVEKIEIKGPPYLEPILFLDSRGEFLEEDFH